MACLEILHYETEMIKSFIEDYTCVGIEVLSDINFGDKEIFFKAIKIGFNPNNWEEHYPYSKVLVEGKPYLLIT